MHRIKLDPKVSVSIVFVVAMFMSIMDTTIVNVALPSIARQLGVPASSIDAVVVAYLVSLAVVMPISGWLGDRWGTKRIFLLALTLFTVSSALCGLANSYFLLIIFRVFQGAAGGALTPVGTAMLYRTFPPSQRVHTWGIASNPVFMAFGVLRERAYWDCGMFVWSHIPLRAHRSNSWALRYRGFRAGWNWTFTHYVCIERGIIFRLDLH